MSEKKPEYNYGTHEVLHMSNFLTGAVSQELCDHHCIIENEEWARLAEEARVSLYKLYQAIGGRIR